MRYSENPGDGMSMFDPATARDDRQTEKTARDEKKEAEGQFCPILRKQDKRVVITTVGSDVICVPARSLQMHTAQKKHEIELKTHTQTHSPVLHSAFMAINSAWEQPDVTGW